MTQCANCEAPFSPPSSMANIDTSALGFVLNEHLCDACQTGRSVMRLVIVRNADGVWKLESAQPLRQTFNVHNNQHHTPVPHAGSPSLAK